jgi:hypothetical protein
LGMEVRIFFFSTAGLYLMSCPVAPASDSLTVRFLPDQRHSPLEDEIPEQPHLPHGDEAPEDEGLVLVGDAASGTATNTSSGMMLSFSQWQLVTSPSSYPHDVEFARIFERCGTRLVLQTGELSTSPPLALPSGSCNTRPTSRALAGPSSSWPGASSPPPSRRSQFRAPSRQGPSLPLVPQKNAFRYR